MTPSLWLLLSLGISLALSLFLLGYSRQPSAQAKDVYLMNWLELVKNIAPFILAAVPGVPPVLIPAIVHGITVAETLPGATGAQKKQSVLDLVVTGINTTNTIVGKTVVSATDVAEGVSAGIDATVAVVNAVHSAQTRTANPNPVPPAQS